MPFLDILAVLPSFCFIPPGPWFIIGVTKWWLCRALLDFYCPFRCALVLPIFPISYLKKPLPPFFPRRLVAVCEIQCTLCYRYALLFAAVDPWVLAVHGPGFSRPFIPSFVSVPFFFLHYLIG